MSEENLPNHPDSNPYSPGGRPWYPAESSDPYQPGPTGYPVQGGYPGVQPGYPGGRAGYPDGQAYPGHPQYPGQPLYSGQPPYPGQPQYPGQPVGYPGQPQDPRQSGGYPGYTHPAAFYASGTGLPPEPMRPNTVTYAFWCWIAAIAFSLVGLVLVLNSPIWDLALATARMTAAEAIAAQSAVNFVKAFIIFLFVAVAALFAFLAYKVRAGRNWSRITIAVLGIVCALLTVPTGRDVTIAARSYLSPQGQWPFYVTAILALAAIVLMFLGVSNRFFAESKTHQQAKAYRRIQQ